MKFKILIILTVIITLSSCFEVVEDITIREDNSGSFKLTANFSQSTSTLNTIMALDSAFGISVPQKSTIKESIQKSEVKLRSTVGITNVNSTMDFENYLFTISYDFKDQYSLNVSFIEVAKLFDKNATIPYQPFEISSTSFKRNHQADLTEHQKKTLTKKFSEGLEKANYISVYRFPNEVQSKSNSKSILAKNKKTVVNRIKLGELLFQPKTLTNTITYK